MLILRCERQRASKDGRDERHPPAAPVDFRGLRRYIPAFAGRCGLTGMPSRLEASPDHSKERKMPKLKTKSSAKKRFFFTGTGKVKMSPAKKRHNLRKRSKSMKRKARGLEIMSDSDAQIVRSYMPYRKGG
jgi:large subunit ribosomal protein L35